MRLIVPEDYLLEYLPWLVLGASAGIVGFVFLRRWRRHPARRRVDAALGLAACVLALFTLYNIAVLAGRHAEQLMLARELGVDLGTYPRPRDFPAEYLADHVRSGADRAEVHAMMQYAHARFSCVQVVSPGEVAAKYPNAGLKPAELARIAASWTYTAEKHLFLSRAPTAAQIVNVFYGSDDLASRVQLVDSADHVGINTCTWF